MVFGRTLALAALLALAGAAAAQTYPAKPIRFIAPFAAGGALDTLTRTIAAQGLPGFDVSAWFGVFATAGTPRPVVDRLNAEIVRVLNLPDVREKLLAIGMEPVTNSPDQFAAYVQSEIAKWAQVVKASGAKAN